MNRLKKVLVFTLVTALLLGIAGCGASKPTGNVNATPNAASSAPAEQTVKEDVDKYAPIEGKTYEYNFTFYQTAPIAENAKMQKFFEEKFNVKFNVWDVEAAKANEIIAQRIIGGEVPDVFSTDLVTWKKYIEQGIVAEIPMDMLEKYAPNIMRSYEKDAPGALNYGKVDGKLYALIGYNVNQWRAPVAYRQDWLDAVGMQIPQNIDEFEKVIYAFTFNDPDQNGKNDTYGLSITGLMPVFGAYGGIPIITGQGGNIPLGGFWQDVNGKLEYSAVQLGMKEALERIAKWYKDGVLDPEFVTGENQGGYWALSHSFINGRIGISGQGMIYHWAPVFYPDLLTGPPSKTNGYYSELAKINPNATVSLGVPPKGPYGQGTFANNDIQSNRIFCFNKDLEKEPDKFAKLISMFDWAFESEENRLTMMYGIKGEDWDIQEKVALDGKLDQALVYLGDFADGKVRSSNFCQAFDIFVPSGNINEATAQQRWKEQVESANYRIMNTLMVSLPSEAIYKADLEKLVVETYFSIILGEKPISEFDKFVDTWYKSGGEQLTKEANEWYSTVEK